MQSLCHSNCIHFTFKLLPILFYRCFLGDFCLVDSRVVKADRKVGREREREREDAQQRATGQTQTDAAAF